MTDLHTHPDYLAALRAIRAAGDDDLERLKLADWLDERAASVACPRCEEGWATSRHRNYQSDDYSSSSARCEHCHGTGRAGDGLAERAELIRVQCELARVMQHRPGHNAGTSTGMRDPTKVWRESVNPLRRRERDLLDAHGRAWAGFDYHYVNAITDHRGEPLSTYIEYERGFPFSVRGPLASLWLSCERCGGRGDVTRFQYGANVAPCPDCHSRGHAGTLAALGPEVLCVGWVKVTERETEGVTLGWGTDFPHGTTVYGWFRHDPDPQYPSWVTPAVFDRLKGGSPTYRGASPSSMLWYASPDIAHAALSAALLELACEPWLRK